jgi:hypothetical protein
VRGQSEAAPPLWLWDFESIITEGMRGKAPAPLRFAGALHKAGLFVGIWNFPGWWMLDVETLNALLVDG